ncbi:MAG: type II toxin-antitoxin system RelE/ParE family toxin [Pyrinomonadaceae bacterium]
MIVILHPEVDSDLLKAMEYYEREAHSELALEFYVEFRRCAGEIGRRPASFLSASNGLRRMNLRRFPFHILFDILDESTVEIFVVKHDRRDQDFGIDRH